MELRKCCNHPFLIRGLEQREFPKSGLTRPQLIVRCAGKLALLNKLLPKLRREGHKVLIFSQFNIMLDVLSDFCAYNSFACVHLPPAAVALLPAKSTASPHHCLPATLLLWRLLLQLRAHRRFRSQLPASASHRSLQLARRRFVRVPAHHACRRGRDQLDGS